MPKLLLRLVVPAVLSTVPGMAATYTVTNLNNSGSGSLREAITSANASSGNTVAFGVSGEITLLSPLPEITKSAVLDGSTAPGFSGTPTVSINFSGRPGLTIAAGADGSTIRALSLVGAGSAGLTLRSSKNTVEGNYIGLLTDGSVRGNLGDGIKILSTSKANLIGNKDAVESVSYSDTSDSEDFTIQPVSAWQGIRNSGTNAGQYLMAGTSGSNGLLYHGPLTGGGTSYTVEYNDPDTISTSVYGPDNLEDGAIRLVGSYKKSGTSSPYNYGFVWEGTPDQLPDGGVYRTIAYPGAVYQYTHSTMGGLAVGNADGPKQVGRKTLPIGPGVAYIYDVASSTFVTNIVFPKSKSNTAYGIWQNGPFSYTICGGYSPLATHNLTDPNRPLEQGKGFLVDYNSQTKKFSNWTSFEYPNGPKGVSFITHFEGISSAEPGTYTLNADSVQSGSENPAQGSWVSVRRNADGSFDKGTWVDLNYPDAPPGVTSSNSVYGDNVVGVVIGDEPFSYQATVNVAFQLSNVISGNRGNGINLTGAKDSVIAMNFIGTDPAGSTAVGYGNGINGILITSAASGNLIGGQAAGVNNPTGSKNPAHAVFQRPPQGNLISGNAAHGVAITGAAKKNTLSGNYIGTDAAGTSALGNGLSGVVIDSSPDNSLIGCTLHQNPFVFYNVIAGNRSHGVRVHNSANITIQANFLGIGSDNATSVPNGGNGLLVSGNSKNTQVGGVIPLGNVISGNSLHGIAVVDTASQFISFNTFGGICAFQTFASPNGLNGILITSTGKNNTIRTCIISGNNANGIEIGGNATGVQITDTSVGTNTTISAAIPNQGTGIVFSGKAHGNTVGGFQPSVEPTVFVSGNKEYGIAVIDEAYNNTIVHTHIGLGAGIAGAIPNEFGGILLDTGSRSTTIGGRTEALQNKIQNNEDAGILIYSSLKNTILNNLVTDNTAVGIYAFGVCTGTTLTANTVTDNGAGGTNNVDISQATGIKLKP